MDAPRTSVDAILQLHDLRLLGTAELFDLEERAERRRSARALAKFFLRATKALETGLFIEAGAKDAATSERAGRYLPDARLVAFEANPYTYQTFHAQRGGGSRVEYHHLALSDRPGEVTFNVRRSLQDGQPLADGHGSLLERPADYVHEFEAVIVEAVTLDGFFAGDTLAPCAMWIDVEGAARKVLDGGQRLLSATQILMIEVEDQAKWEGAWTAPEVMAYLAERGFVPIARDFEYRYQYNVVYVRDELLRCHGRLRLRLSTHLSGLAHSKQLAPSSEPSAGQGAT